jgi:hypothetical protein
MATTAKYQASAKVADAIGQGVEATGVRWMAKGRKTGGRQKGTPNKNNRARILAVLGGPLLLFDERILLSRFAALGGQRHPAGGIQSL